MKRHGLIYMKPASKMTRLLCAQRFSITMLLFSLFAAGCGDDPFGRPDDLIVPETLKVPPVDDKQSALQALLDGVVQSLAVGEQHCDLTDDGDRTKTVKCTYPNGGTVEFVGDIFEQNRDLFVFGEKVRSVRYEMTLNSIKLENFQYKASQGNSRIPPPNGCKADVFISGEGSLYTVKEDLLTRADNRLPLNSGGVYQGRFTVENSDRVFDFEFTNHGFYYRRDVTPIVIRPEEPATDGRRRPPIEALQVSLVYSGGFNLNEQLYSYQDVFIEVLTSDHWNEECDPDRRERPPRSM